MTGNPVECVIHPDLWNKSKIWDPMGVGQFYEDQYEEEYVGYPITSVSNLSPVLSVIQSTKASGELSLSPLLSFPDFRWFR